MTAPRMGTFSSGLLTAALTTPERVKVDFRNYAFIGNVSEDVRVCYLWHAAGVRSWQDMLARPQVIFAASAAGTAGNVESAMLRDLFGVKVKQVQGYPGSADKRLAVEKGEVDGDCGGWTSVPDDWLRDHKIDVIVRLSPTLLPGMDANVPFAGDLVKDQRERQMFDFLMAPEKLGRLFMVSGRVPAERVAALRKAFDAMVADPAFLGEADKLRLLVTPMTRSAGRGRRRRALRHAAGPRRQGQDHHRRMMTAHPGAKRGWNLLHHDGGAAHAFALNDAVQHGGIRRVQSYAAVRGRPAKPCDLVAAVNGKPAVEEDRVRHRRIVVFAREPARRHHLRMIGAARRAVAGAAGRDLPDITRLAVDDDAHGLARAADLDQDRGLGAIGSREKANEQRGKCGRESKATHSDSPDANPSPFPLHHCGTAGDL